METIASSVLDVEHWNDTFAREHDIDDYYARSGFLIRWIERRRLASIRTLLDVAPGHKILEAGCGGGHILRLFPYNELTGVDPSGEMIQKSSRNLAGYQVRLLKGELHEVGLANGGFDRIICSEVLEHVVDPEAVLTEIKRLLAPNGRVVITFPNDPLVNRIKALIRGSGMTILPPFRRISWGGDRYHLHRWRPREMHALLSRYFSVTTVRFAPSRLLPVRCCFQCVHTT